MTDLILLLILLLFSFIGFKRGFIRTVVGLTSTIISLILTALLYPQLSNAIYNSTIGDSIEEYFIELMSSGTEVELLAETTAKTASVICINVISFLLVIIVIKMMLMLLLKSLNLIAKLPILRQANAVLGMCSGFVSGLLICYIIIGVVSALSTNGFIEPKWDEALKTSVLASLIYENNAITNILTDII